MRSLLRVLVATLALAVTYLAIDNAWLFVMGRLFYAGWSFIDPAREFGGQAAEVAEASRVRESALDRGAPATVFRFGVEYGYLSERREDVPAPLQNLSRASFETHARALGVTSVAPLAIPDATNFVASTQNLEDDPGGVAARVEQATSPRLRHLFLLGSHAGSELARLASAKDESVPAPVQLVGMHGVLAGIPEPLWRGLTRVSPRLDTALPEYKQRVTEVVAYLEEAQSALAR